MAAAGSPWINCRPLRRVSACCRNRESSFVARYSIWILTVLVLLAIGIAFNGFFQNRTGVVRFAAGERDAERIVESRSPTIESPSAADIPVNHHGDRVNRRVVDHVTRKYARKKAASAPDDALETPVKSQVVIEPDANGNAPRLDFNDLPPQRSQPSGNSDAGNGVTMRDGEALTGAKPTTAINARFQCPQSFVINDPDATWFRTSVAQKSQKRDVTDGTADDVLILTPISNVKRHLRRYFENICSLSYPHRHISIVLGEDSSTDQTLEEADRLAREVRPYFKRVEVIRLKGTASRTSGHGRHEMSFQLVRRRHLAMARNQLLFSALRDEKWILWTDSDIRHIPADLVERLLWPQKSIVVANCLYKRDDRQTDTFDRNTWRDTEASKRHLARKPEEFLMLEGYEPTQRKFLNDLKEEGDVVRIDGVGGCVLLVEADVHRRGLVFPSFIFDHHVETEGLAKMAAKMGVEMYGLPSVNVIHW